MLTASDNFLSKKKKSHASSPSPSEARLCFEKETNNKSVYIISVSVCRCFLGQFVFFLFVSQWIPVILCHSPTQGWIQKGRKYMKRNQKWVYLSKLKEKGNKRSYTGGSQWRCDSSLKSKVIFFSGRLSQDESLVRVLSQVILLITWSNCAPVPFLRLHFSGQCADNPVSDVCCLVASLVRLWAEGPWASYVKMSCNWMFYFISGSFYQTVHSPDL